MAVTCTRNLQLILLLVLCHFLFLDVLAQDCTDPKLTSERVRHYINGLPSTLETPSTNDTGIKSFFKKVDGKVDLVIFMDRSLGLNRHEFYLSERQIVHDILKYHTPIDKDLVRLELITFAKTLDRVVTGITGTAINKCQLFEGQDSLWHQVVYKTVDHGGTFIMAAFERAVEIFTFSQNSRPTAKRLMLVVSDGSFTGNMNPTNEKKALLQMGVEIFTMSTGHWSYSQFGNVQILASDDSYYMNDIGWIKVIRTTKPLIGKCNNNNISNLILQYSLVVITLLCHIQKILL